MEILVLCIAFGASIVGAICGIGGGKKTESRKVICPWAPSGVASMVIQKAAELKDLYGKILNDAEVTSWLNNTMLLEADTMTVADVEAHIENVKNIVNEYKDMLPVNS